MNTKYFIVTSHGWSASNWVAHALSLNKMITCTHSARNILADDTTVHDEVNLKNNITKFHSGYLNRQGKSMDETYDEIEHFGKTPYFGSVHFYRLRDLPVLFEKYGPPKRTFNVVNLIRNPVALVWSGYGQFKDLFRIDINELYWTTGKVLKEREFVYQLAEKYDLYVGDFEVLAFLGACAVLESLKMDIDAEQRLDSIPYIDYRGRVKMEEITSDKAVLRGLIERLTEDDNAVDEEYLDAVYKVGAINKHKHDKKSVTPKERYDGFTPWQKEAFNYFMGLFGLNEAYERFGYDLSFLPEK